MRAAVLREVGRRAFENRGGGPRGVTEWEREDTVHQCLQDEALAKRLSGLANGSSR